VFQRPALADTTPGGQQIRTGQRVGLFYRSANFVEGVFEHPERFDIRRSPNPHLGFGGSGAYLCLGASLARLEIDWSSTRSPMTCRASGWPVSRGGCARAGSTA
jgi:cholest-4-en-3-one 26-monooxygenase